MQDIPHPVRTAGGGPYGAAALSSARCVLFIENEVI